MRFTCIYLMRCFFNSVAIPSRNFDHYGSRSIRNAVAPQTRFDRGARCLFEFVQLFITRLVARVQTLAHNDVAGRAGKDTAAGMFERNVMSLANIQDRPWQTRSFVGNIARVNRENVGFAVMKNSYLVRLPGLFIRLWGKIRISSCHNTFTVPAGGGFTQPVAPLVGAWYSATDFYQEQLSKTL